MRLRRLTTPAHNRSVIEAIRQLAADARWTTKDLARATDLSVEKVRLVLSPA